MKCEKEPSGVYLDMDDQDRWDVIEAIAVKGDPVPRDYVLSLLADVRALDKLCTEHLESYKDLGRVLEEHKTIAEAHGRELEDLVNKLESERYQEGLYRLDEARINARLLRDVWLLRKELREAKP